MVSEKAYQPQQNDPHDQSSARCNISLDESEDERIDHCRDQTHKGITIELFDLLRMERPLRLRC